MAHGTHDYDVDPRNDLILISVNGDLKPRAEASVSVFDSGFMLGDGVWEGVRVHRGGIPFAASHLDRLFADAKAIDMDIGKSREQLLQDVRTVLQANNMTTDVHVRLMVSRGVKSTPYQDPRFTVSDPTIVIIPEYKLPRPETLQQGVRLATVSVRRGRPDVQDPKLNSHSKLNCITACIQAAKAGADEGLMLDPQGFVATCNSTHFFIVHQPFGSSEHQVWTSTGDYCMPGITRQNVLELCRNNGLPIRERNFSLTDVYSAREAFVTGTFAGVAPVQDVDGRQIGSGARGPVTQRLQELYQTLVDQSAAATPL